MRRVLLTPEAQPIDVPEPGYSALLVDPPWRYEDEGGRGAAAHHYAGLTVDQLVAMPVRGLLHARSVVGLWTTGHVLIDGSVARVLRSWGLDPRRTQIIDWAKRRTVRPGQGPRTEIDPYDIRRGWRVLGPLQIGTGSIVRACVERLLVALMPKARIPTALRPVGLVEYPARGTGLGHSVKPPWAHDLLEAVAPEGPRAELFARRARPGWTTWGLQAPSNATDETPGGAGQGGGR